MQTIRLKQIEADVVLVGVNSEELSVHCLALWECGMTDDELRQMAAHFALRWVEMDGVGEMHVSVQDFRPRKKAKTA